MHRLMVVFALGFAIRVSAQENLTRLLRQPDIHGDRIAFVYAGDIWIVASEGGEARRLTADAGVEYFPKFSPDGRWIAFCAEYSGTRQVYVMSVDGGVPRQLTYYNDVGPIPPRGGIDNRVVDWTVDGKYILFLPHRLPWNDRMGRHYIVPVAGGMETPLAIPEGSGGMYSPDGTKLVYTPIEREFRSWKRYRGGRTQDIWIYDLTTNRAEQITSDPGNENQPMWMGNTIYFTSDRNAGKLNLWSYDLTTKESRQLTAHSDYDVLWPSSDRHQVVYENGGYIWRYDPTTLRSLRVPIHVSGDFKGKLPYFRSVKDEISSYAISPTGMRAVFEARGDIFTVPAKHGEIRNLTQTPGIREMSPFWSPDGKSIAYLSDRHGDEYEIYIRSADGSEERQLTRDGRAWKFEPRWSPNSELIAFSDKDHRLHIVDVRTGQLTTVDRDAYLDIRHYRWSPDSRWIAYTKNNAVRFGTIYVYSIPEGQSYALTSGATDDNGPVFDPKGRYLYFTSNRDINLTFSAFEFNYVATDPTRIYVGVLDDDTPAPLLARSDEEENPPAPKEPEKKEPAPPVVVKIDPARFEKRVRALPGTPGQYNNLQAFDDGVLYLTRFENAALKFYDLEQRKEETILENVRSYELSANREKLVLRTGSDYAILNIKAGQQLNDSKLALAGMEIKVDPPAEWAQEFNDAWRIFRDWFYDPKLHGVDWSLMRQRYGQLVPYLAHRVDLDYILTELVGELNAGHAYVETSTDWQVKRTNSGLLGAEIVPDSGYYRIAHIFPGENWHDAFRSPLTEAGVKVREGDYILAVDGVSTQGVDNFYRLLENKADRVVTLLVNSKADRQGARQEKVRPVTKETGLRYLDWVHSRREMVDKASGGRIGYIHVPNTARQGNVELFKHFYPMVTKQALIIDDRYNGGGFIPDRMIELLDRDILSYLIRRQSLPVSVPGYAHVGPKAMLINAYAGSGGDLLPFYFRKQKLGPLIGTRTWGGVIGLTTSPRLVDGGQVTPPQSRFLDSDGTWMIEGIGVAPDIEVVDRPDSVAAGRDPSLEKAIEVLLRELERQPRKDVIVPPAPTDL